MPIKMLRCSKHGFCKHTQVFACDLCANENRETQIADIGKAYDIFFGDGLWERDYKKHIVAFAEHCVKAALENKEVLKSSHNTASTPFCTHCGTDNVHLVTQTLCKDCAPKR